MPPHTNKRRTTPNLKTTNNQNCQKIKLYGSPTTKELKKKHLFRRGGDRQLGQRGCMAKWWLEYLVVAHVCMGKLEGTNGE